MALLSREAILNAEDIKTEQVAVPEWGGDVLVGSMSGTARDRYEQSIISSDDKGNHKQNLENIRAKLLAVCIVDEDGKPLFTDKDIAELGKKSVAALDRVFVVAQKLNAVSDEDIAELAKN